MAAEISQIDYSSGRGRRRSGGRRLLRWLFLLLLLGLLAGGGYQLWEKMLEPLLPKENSPRSAIPTPSRYGDLENPEYLELAPFVVNLADRRHYVRATIVLLLSEKRAKLFLERRLPEVRDVILSELQNSTTEQLAAIGERTLLRQRLLNRVASILPDRSTAWDDPAPLKRLLITEFYLQ